MVAVELSPIPDDFLLLGSQPLQTLQLLSRLLESASAECLRSVPAHEAAVSPPGPVELCPTRHVEHFPKHRQEKRLAAERNMEQLRLQYVAREERYGRSATSGKLVVVRRRKDE